MLNEGLNWPKRRVLQRSQKALRGDGAFNDLEDKKGHSRIDRFRSGFFLKT